MKPATITTFFKSDDYSLKLLSFFLYVLILFPLYVFMDPKFQMVLYFILRKDDRL